jgi:hypothetical protein
MKQSTTLSYVGWLSLVTLSWLIVTGQLPPTFVTWFFWGFFLVFAVMASAISVSHQQVGKHGR